MLAESLFNRVVEQLRSLKPARQAAFVESVNDRIRDTARREASLDDLTMASLARRLYLVGLNRGREIERQVSGKITPKHVAVQDAMEGFRLETLPLAGIASLLGHDHLVDNFYTHKVSARGPDAHGFLLLTAMFVWARDLQGEFKPEACQALIPASEIGLSDDIGLFIARRLKEEAHNAGVADPFPDIRPPQLDNDFDKVNFSFLQHLGDGERLEQFFNRYQTPKNPKSDFGDGNAHLIIYRARRSTAADMMKSYLVLQPLRTDRQNPKKRHHPAVHFYRAPERAGGGRVLATPGRALPLEAGLFIIGGQRKQPVKQKKDDLVREPAVPFRSLEILFFPWKALEDTPLFAGLALTINNKGVPLITRICARPTLLQNYDQARIAAVPLTRCAADLETDLDQEELLYLAEGEPDAGDFLPALKSFGDAVDLVGEILKLSNNSSGGGWSVQPGFVKKDGRALEALDIRVAIKAAFDGLAMRDNEVFDPFQHVRISPLEALI